MSEAPVRGTMCGARPGLCEHLNPLLRRNVKIERVDVKYLPGHLGLAHIERLDLDLFRLPLLADPGHRETAARYRYKIETDECTCNLLRVCDSLRVVPGFRKCRKWHDY